MPFVSEEIYQALHASKYVTICTSSWPKLDERFNEKVEIMDLIQDIITNVRATKNEYNLAPSKPIDITISCKDEDALSKLQAAHSYLVKFTNPKNLVLTLDQVSSEGNVLVVLSKANIYIPFAELVDIEKEIARLQGEEKKLTGEIKRAQGMLNNEKFISKAPEAKIAEEKAKLEKYTQMMEQVKERLLQLKK